VNNCTKLLFLVLGALLVKSACGFGQQAPAGRFESLVAESRRAQDAQDFPAAVAALKQAVKIEPSMAELWANLGLMQRQAGDEPGAIVSLQHALQLKPSLYVPNLFLGISYLKLGKAADAVPLLVKAEKMNEKDPQAPLALGRAYFLTRKYAAAAKELDRVTVLDPKSGTGWFSLGMARLNEVEDEARILSKEGKTSPFAGALYAESLHKQGRFGEAASLYKTLIDAPHQPPCLRAELGLSLLRGHDESAAVAEFAQERAAHPECSLAFLGQARLAIDRGQNEQMAALVKDLWVRDHGYVETNAGILLEGLSSEKVTAVVNYITTREDAVIPSDLQQALLHAFSLSDAEPQDSSPAVASSAPVKTLSESDAHRTAESYYVSGQFQQCARRVDAAAVKPNLDKLRLLAACSFFTGDNQRAAFAADAMKTLDPHSAEALYWSIQAKERIAFQALARFQQMEPDSAKSHVLLGDIYHQLERNDDAQVEFSKALSLAPQDLAAMLGLATVYLSNNNIEGAADLTASALLNRPDDPELNLIMAQVKLAKFQYADALPFLEKSLRAKPQMLPRVHTLMGKAYAELGRTQEAIEQLKMGVSSDEDGAIQYLLARLYRKMGDNQSAAQALAQMQTIKEQRRARGVKQVQDPDLSALESSPVPSSNP
jgi:tetratricopeptide (TPR) repeat protein